MITLIILIALPGPVPTAEEIRGGAAAPIDPQPTHRGAGLEPLRKVITAPYIEMLIILKDRAFPTADNDLKMIQGPRSSFALLLFLGATPPGTEHHNLH